MRIALVSLCAVLSVGFMFQERAKPRDTQPRRESPPASHPRAGGDAQRPPTAQPAPPPPSGPTQARPQDQAERRHPQAGRTVDPRRRHPRPDLDHLWRRQQWYWNDWQYNWWRGPNEYAWFPYHYPPSWYYEFWLFGYRCNPRDPIWDPYDDQWFFWPYRDAPPFGCGEYWVPTHRTAVYDPMYGWRWKYWDWRLRYFCVD